MTAAATTTQEASLAALNASGYLNVKITSGKRPCEVPFLFATFSLGIQRKSRFKIKKSFHATGAH